MSFSYAETNPRLVFLYKFFLTVVEFQCCVSFRCTAKWFSYTYICIYILFHILFHYSLLQDIEYSFLCYTVWPCCLSILYVVVCIYSSQTPYLFLIPPLFFLTWIWQTDNFFLPLIWVIRPSVLFNDSIMGQEEMTANGISPISIC